MTHRERFIHALDRKPPSGRVPHFELVFFLTMEAFGKVHPVHRNYRQWDQMSETERDLHRKDIADIYIRTAETYEHSAIYLHTNPDREEERRRLIGLVREKTGDEYFLCIPGDATYSIPQGDSMTEFSFRLVDDPEGLKDEAEKRVDEKLAAAERMKDAGFDGFAMCSDYCFNTGPFLSPDQFSEFIAPYLKRLVQGYRELGYYTIKHTDGNILPILDDLLDSGPHALHSLDPQGGVDIAEVKKTAGDQVCLIGNVNCGALDTGTEEEVAESARYCLKHGMPGGGYIFSTSNCVYTGMKLDRYELMLDIWRKEGNY